MLATIKNMLKGEELKMHRGICTQLCGERSLA